MINIFSITIRNDVGNKGKTTVLNICEYALKVHGYATTADDAKHVLYAEKKDALTPERKMRDIRRLKQQGYLD